MDALEEKNRNGLNDDAGDNGGAHSTRTNAANGDARVITYATSSTATASAPRVTSNPTDYSDALEVLMSPRQSVANSAKKTESSSSNPWAASKSTVSKGFIDFKSGPRPSEDKESANEPLLSGQQSSGGGGSSSVVDTFGRGGFVQVPTARDSVVSMNGVMVRKILQPIQASLQGAASKKGKAKHTKTKGGEHKEESATSGNAEDTHRELGSSDSTSVLKHPPVAMDLGSSIKTVTTEDGESSSSDDEDANEDVCFICMEAFNDTNPRWTLECVCQKDIEDPIAVHGRCIRKWKLCGNNALCPLCRQPLPATKALSYQLPTGGSGAPLQKKLSHVYRRPDFNVDTWEVPTLVCEWMLNNPVPPEQASTEEIIDLLAQLELGHYVDVFFEEELDGGALRNLNEEDLKDLGVAEGRDLARFNCMLEVLKGRLTVDYHFPEVLTTAV